LANTEPELLSNDGITPQYEHQYVEGRDWQSGPIGKTFRSPCFGMLKDRFGVGWMVSLAT
jgi:uncharacterized glyoxalase superfamily protein PhnB